MSNKTYADFESKKSLHFNITRETHTQLRIICFKNRVSMQEVFEEIAQMISAESPVMMRIVEDVAVKKKERLIEKLSETDAESLFNIIAEESPLSE